MQLGTPDEATPKAVRRYLKEFLWDRRVVDLNRVLWFFILNGIILTFRPKKSAALYKRFFEKHGPTLRLYSESLTQKIATLFKAQSENFVVAYGMRYGNPSLKKVFADLVDTQNCSQILVVPLFPQFCFATTGSVFDAVMTNLQLVSKNIKTRIIGPIHQNKLYMESLTKIINEKIKAVPDYERLIVSYHGIPERYVNNGDPYFKMCTQTTELLSQHINFPKDKIMQCFQSRFGKEEWLKPYTDVTIESLAHQGVKKIAVVCPSFSMDCLETLDEIGEECQELFLENGGEKLDLISCLNDHDFWVGNFHQLLTEELVKM